MRFLQAATLALLSALPLISAFSHENLYARDAGLSEHSADLYARDAAIADYYDLNERDVDVADVYARDTAFAELYAREDKLDRIYARAVDLQRRTSAEAWLNSGNIALSHAVHTHDMATMHGQARVALQSFRNALQYTQSPQLIAQLNADIYKCEQLGG
ncbi:hypothetical protein MMC13_004384 [Lambiella insularis]|nr:hypothetical protein [Lambiella insularis]